MSYVSKSLAERVNELEMVNEKRMVAINELLDMVYMLRERIKAQDVAIDALENGGVRDTPKETIHNGIIR